jgi:transposase-like protein
MAARKRRSYTKAQRKAVLADVRTMGVCEAARKHGMPQTSVSNWVVVATRFLRPRIARESGMHKT